MKTLLSTVPEVPKSTAQYATHGKEVEGYVLYTRSREKLVHTPLIRTQSPVTVSELTRRYFNDGPTGNFYFQDIFEAALQFHQQDEMVPFGQYYMREACLTNFPGVSRVATPTTKDSRKANLTESEESHYLLEFYLMHFCVMFYSLDKVKLEDLGNEKKDPICTWVIDVKQGIVWGLPANLSLENIQDQIGRTDVAVGGYVYSNEIVPEGVYFVQESLFLKPRKLFTPLRKTPYQWIKNRLPLSYNEIYNDSMRPMTSEKHKVVIDAGNIYSFPENIQWSKCLKHLSATGSDLIELSSIPSESNGNMESTVSTGLFRIQRKRQAYSLASTGDLIYVEQSINGTKSNFITDAHRVSAIYEQIQIDETSLITVQPNPNIDIRKFGEHYNKKRNNFMHLCVRINFLRKIHKTEFHNPISACISTNQCVISGKPCDVEGRICSSQYSDKLVESLYTKAHKKGEEVFSHKIPENAETGKVEVREGTRKNEDREKFSYHVTDLHLRTFQVQRNELCR